MHYKKTIAYIFLGCLPHFFTIPMQGQVTGEWISAEIGFDLPKSFGFETEVEGRYINIDGILTNSYHIDFGLDYKIDNRWDISASYRFKQNHENDGYFHARHRFYFDIDYDNSWKRFEYTYRMRTQRETRQYIEDAFDAIPEYEWRNKMEIALDLNSDWTPYIAQEIFIPLNLFTPFRIFDTRTILGVDIPIINNHEIDIGIMYDQEIYPENLYSFVLRLGYSFSAN